MDIKEVQTVLKEKFPQLVFNLHQTRYSYKQRVVSNVYNKLKNVKFEVAFELDGKYLIIYYCFGKIESDYEALFFVNKFNLVSPICFKAAIKRVEEDDYFIIRYLQPIASVKKIPNIFYNSSQTLFNIVEFQLLYKRIKAEGLDKIMN